MKPRNKPKKENNERWLLTYSDLITLLMIFFVVMYSMSNIDKAKYEKIANSMSSSMGGNSFFSDITEQNTTSTIEQSGTSEEEFNEFKDLKEKINTIISQNKSEDEIIVTEYEKGLVISFKDGILFDSGSNILKEESYNRLSKIGEILKNSYSYARIEGHTDNIPISNNLFSSNWELSSARATTVLNFFVENRYISPEKICSVGYGEYRPKDTNDTEAGRNNNRRVDIVLVNSKFEEIEK